MADHMNAVGVTPARPLAGLEATYAELPDRFYTRQAPTPVGAPQLIKVNRPLAALLGLDPEVLATPDGVAVLAGNVVPDGARPISAVYAGHQFGGFVPQLGDGRAVLLGEIVARDGIRRDIQLKGAGPTPYSRMGDGRAALGPVLREYIVSEGMAGLGIPTTRALAAVLTGDAVYREGALPGAILTRVAQSHIRVGTFQYFAARQDIDGLKTLADYAIARHYPELTGMANPYRALLDHVVARQALLVAQWLNVGFIHGVMNTDNVSIAGETIDFGPCAFMDAYDPAAVFSSIDRQGRYAYGNQPNIAQWNLACFAHALLPLLGENEEAQVAQAKDAIGAYPKAFETAWEDGLRAKVGLAGGGDVGLAFAQELLSLMAADRADFTLTFRALCDCASGQEAGEAKFLAQFPGSGDGVRAWLVKWRARLAQAHGDWRQAGDAMRAVNPAYIARNHMVEKAIDDAMGGDFSTFAQMVAVLADPFSTQDGAEAYARPPLPHEVVHQTFCGT